MTSIDPTSISPDLCVGNNLRKAMRAVTQAYDDALRPVGLTINQFSLLGTLYEHAPISVMALSGLVGSDRTTLARNLKPLARDGYLSIEPDPADRRAKRISLTPAGEEILIQAAPYWAEVQREFVAALGPAKLNIFMDMMAQFQEI